MKKAGARTRNPGGEQRPLSPLQKKSRDWNENSYKAGGFGAQRLYPNEELLRFLGREWFSKTKPRERRRIKILELGCGSCSNLWMISKEGFDAYGIDIAPTALMLGRKMLRKWGVGADLTLGNMTALPYKDRTFDAVVDVFSAYSLCSSDYDLCLKEVSRVLKKNGKFFSYTPSMISDAFRSHAPARMIDRFTLNGIYRKTSPYSGNPHPHRFTSTTHFKELLEKNGFRVTYLETVGRTYRNEREQFEFVTAVGSRR